MSRDFFIFMLGLTLGVALSVLVILGIYIAMNGLESVPVTPTLTLTFTPTNISTATYTPIPMTSTSTPTATPTAFP